MEDVETALLYLAARLPGWHVWHTGGRGTSVWSAVPAPAGTRMHDIENLPGRVDGLTPNALIEACAARYGWAETCPVCRKPARECGHRERGHR